MSVHEESRRLNCLHWALYPSLVSNTVCNPSSDPSPSAFEVFLSQLVPSTPQYRKSGQKCYILLRFYFLKPKKHYSFPPCDSFASIVHQSLSLAAKYTSHVFVFPQLNNAAADLLVSPGAKASGCPTKWWIPPTTRWIRHKVMFSWNALLKKQFLIVLSCSGWRVSEGCWRAQLGPEGTAVMIIQGLSLLWFDFSDLTSPHPPPAPPHPPITPQLCHHKNLSAGPCPLQIANISPPPCHNTSVCSAWFIDYVDCE